MYFRSGVAAAKQTALPLCVKVVRYAISVAVFAGGLAGCLTHSLETTADMGAPPHDVSVVCRRR